MICACIITQQFKIQQDRQDIAYLKQVEVFEDDDSDEGSVDDTRRSSSRSRLFKQYAKGDEFKQPSKYSKYSKGGKSTHSKH